MPVLDAHDVLLIADEVVTGFGRLGTMFGSEHYGLRPDLVTIAKGLTSAYAPLSGSIVSDRMFAVLCEAVDRFGPIGHGWTYSAHPIGCAAGVANLTLIDSMGLVGNAATVGAHLLAELRAGLAGHPHVAEVRGAGLLCAVELAKDPGERIPFDPAAGVTAAAVAHMRAHGVIARAMPEGEIIGLAPPLCLTREEADQVVAATVAAIAAIAA